MTCGRNPARTRCSSESSASEKRRFPTDCWADFRAMRDSGLPTEASAFALRATARQARGGRTRNRSRRARARRGASRWTAGRKPSRKARWFGPSRTRTCDLLVRSQTLYPTELWALRKVRTSNPTIVRSARETAARRAAARRGAGASPAPSEPRADRGAWPTPRVRPATNTRSGRAGDRTFGLDGAPS